MRFLALRPIVSAMENARERLLATLPVKERRLLVAGISTALLDGGEGPPVVLLHGPLGSAVHWMGVIPGLARNHRVIVPDLPGHGASELIDGDLSIQHVLAWLGELIWRTCVAPPVLVGQLLGGAIAARFAIEQGSRLSRLVLVDTFGLQPMQLPPQFAQALAGFLADPDAHTHRSLWRHCSFDLEALRERLGPRWDPFEAYNIERARAPEVQAAVSRLMAQFAASAIAPESLARIGVPTALIWGRHDLATPLPMAEAAARRYGWPLHVIENANDDPPLEQPEELLRVLRTILEPSFSAEAC
jgi:pimeloyl-ACP methyl ester carboxylesterase